MLSPVHRRHHPLPNELLGVSLLLCFGVPPYGAKLPRIINSTNSLVVEGVDRNHSGYILTLRSTSLVAVYGIAVAILAKNGACVLHMIGSPVGTFMDPLKNCRLEPLLLPCSNIGPFPLPPSKKNRWEPRIGSCSDSGARALKPRNLPEIVIEAVDFQNGAFEGNMAEAATFEANRFGRNTQNRVIAKIVESRFGQDFGVISCDPLQQTLHFLQIGIVGNSD